ncbi:MAG: tetraacyldisaccharide 4'-kinase, partial [Gemmatimonadota bacterium]|nr:tetraacyldisaccharide 4'-kinase [Gemmatimonadota bacterium]
LPLSLLYRGATAMRNAAYDSGMFASEEPALPCVSVGNLTVGGTGKTPISAWLARRLLDAGAHPAIVLRGYGDDEPLVHARLTPDLPVVVNANRLEAISRAAEEGADVAVLDDGFQHRRVARIADIVLVSADAPDALVRMLPSGPYREGMRALGRASIVIVTRKAASLAQAQAVAARVVNTTPGVPVAIAHLALDAIHFEGRTPARLATIEQRRVLAIAGVGNAAAFGDQLRQAGATVRMRAFADHYPFTDADAKALARDLGTDEIALCTLKDAVKLLPLWPREAAAIGYVSQAVIVEENGGAIDAILELVVHARLRQH